MRSKRYRAALEKIDPAKQYTLDDAIQAVQSTATTKVPGSLEVHIRLGIDASKADQVVRGTLTPPHATGKQVRIAVFAKGSAAEAAKQAGADIVGEADLIAEIKKTEKTNFDLAIATPEMMKTLAPIAKILGTRGLMPNPKNETVTPDPAKAVEAWRKGKLAFRSDASGNLHAAVGKVTLPAADLKANLQAFLEAVKKAKPAEVKGTYIQAVTLASSMGPGIKVDQTSL